MPPNEIVWKVSTTGKEVQHTVNSTTVSALKTCSKVYVAIKFPVSSVDDDVFVHAPPAGHDFECTHDFGWELLINGGLPPLQTFSRWLEWLRNHHLITKDARF
jgi:hypothetical protein